MNFTPALPRTFQPLIVYPSNAGQVTAAAPAPMVSASGAPVARPPALSILSDGSAPVDRGSLEHPVTGLQMPASTLFMNELPGTTPIEKGLALLDQIRTRKAQGEFSAYTPTLLFFHGTVESGELMLGDANGSILLPATVLLHTLSRELESTAHGHDSRVPAPIVLSCCHAEWLADSVRDFPRPIVLNGSKKEVDTLDAFQVFATCVKSIEHAWRSDLPVDPRQLFEAITTTSGERAHLLHDGDWLFHQLPYTTAGLHRVNAQQAGLYLRSQLMHGTVDALAEGLLLFGRSPLHQIDPLMTPLQALLMAGTRDIQAKMRLLLAIGEAADPVDEDGETLLHDICGCPADSGETDAAGFSALRTTVAALLLDHGADPHKPNRNGVTPAALAVSSGDPALAELLARGRSGTPEQHRLQLAAMALQEAWESVTSLLDDPEQIDDAPDHASMDVDSVASDSDDDQ